MNDYQLTRLTSERRRTFEDEASASRMVRAARGRQARRVKGPRSTIRLTLSYVFGLGPA